MSTTSFPLAWASASGTISRNSPTIHSVTVGTTRAGHDPWLERIASPAVCWAFAFLFRPFYGCGYILQNDVVCIGAGVEARQLRDFESVEEPSGFAHTAVEGGQREGCVALAKATRASRRDEAPIGAQCRVKLPEEPRLVHIPLRGHICKPHVTGVDHTSHHASQVLFHASMMVCGRIDFPCDRHASQALAIDACWRISTL